ncbi:MAG TPA: chemotaxis protein CheA [Ignavibacteriales bacterium]|nr:chemotaxis protein CheA [Ignavibacteriales bacterium]
MLDHLKQSFLEETKELLSQLEESLLELENESNDAELISKVFRILHTIKGSAGMFDFDDVSKFTHDIENVFDLIRNGEIKADKNIISLTLKAKDQIEKLLEKKSTLGDDETLRLVEAFGSIMAGFRQSGTNGKTSLKESPAVSRKAGEELTTYFIKFKPAQDILQNGTNPLLLLNELRDLGECCLSMITDKIPGFKDLDPEKCYVCWNILLRTEKNMDAIRDVFIFVEDDCELIISIIEDDNLSALKTLEEHHQEITGILSEDPSNIIERLKSLFRDKAGLQEVVAAAPAATVSGLPRNSKAEKAAEAESVSNIKVSSEKLDYLVNLVGELVTVQARLSQTASQKMDPELMAISEEVERLTCELRDNALNIRMVPIRSTFNRFKRLVRDLSQELGKKVDLFTEGDETELDKNVIDKLNDPLIHLVRNSLDHGIEASHIRREQGKSENGVVILSAGYSGSNVVIRITDDGRGLDKETIRKKAVEKGIIAKDAVLTEKEIYNLVFMPGFSTAEKVSSVSGRGVGMDVVRKTIESLRGSIDITSEYEIGTTITMKLPLTLAIIEGLLVQIGDDYFIIPLSAVEECIELRRSEMKNENGMHLVNVRGELVPFISLRERFNISDSPGEIEQVVITTGESGKSGKDTKIGFVVDKVIGEHQTVIKSLGKFYKDAEGISGATILGDGTLALILDIASLVKREEELEKQLFQNR